MRLIDADKINFEEVFVGASDFAKDIRSAAEELIKRQPTAFDKEKVKIQIKNKAGIGMCQEKKCKKFSNDCDECRVETAIEIVEKGGVE